MKKAVYLIFSLDSAFQLEGTINSLISNCLDLEEIDLKVFYLSLSDKFQEQYNVLTQEYLNIEFFYLLEIKEQLLNILNDYEYVFFIYDTTIFTRKFSIKETISYFKDETLFFSLQQGNNTPYCYCSELNENDIKPEIITEIDEKVQKYDFNNFKHNHNFKEDLFASVYKTESIINLLKEGTYNLINFNDYLFSELFKIQDKFVLSYKTSICFSNGSFNFKDSNDFDYLYNAFDNGKRLRTEIYHGFVPESCHRITDYFFYYKDSQTLTKSINSLASKPLISVVIPCYNQAHFLTQALESIIKQNYANLEIFIINDGSNDNTSEVANFLQEKYLNSNIILINQENQGLAMARNNAIKQAKGDWILPLDADDMFEADFIYEAVKLINNNSNLNLVTTNLKSFENSFGGWDRYPYSPVNVTKINTFFYASMYKKELWEKVNGYTPILPWEAEDWNFWISLSEYELNIATIPEKLFMYRIRANSMVSKVLEYFEETKSFIKTLHPELYNKEDLAQAYKIIQEVDEPTFNKIIYKNKKFPDYPQSYFWLGLIAEKNNNLTDAFELYKKAESLASASDYQYSEHLYNLSKKLTLKNELKKYNSIFNEKYKKALYRNKKFMQLENRFNK